MRIEQSTDPNCTIIWSTWKDNKFLDKEYQEYLAGLEKEDQYFYGIYTLGEWTPINVVGRIYKKYVDTLEGNLYKYEYKPELPIILCCDFNVDPMKWALMQNINGSDYLFDEVVQYDTITENMAKEIDRRYPGKRFIIYGDYTGNYRSTRSRKTEYDLIKEYLRNSDVRIKPNPPIMDRINAMHWRICNKEGVRRFFIDPKCEHARKDFREVILKPGTHEEEQTVINNKKELSHIQAEVGYYMEFNYSLRGQPRAVLTRR